MFPNLKAEMARYGLSCAQIAASIGRSISGMDNRLRGKATLSISEAILLMTHCCSSRSFTRARRSCASCAAVLSTLCETPCRCFTFWGIRPMRNSDVARRKFESCMIRLSHCIIRSGIRTTPLIMRPRRFVGALRCSRTAYNSSCRAAQKFSTTQERHCTTASGRTRREFAMGKHTSSSCRMIGASWSRASRLRTVRSSKQSSTAISRRTKSRRSTPRSSRGLRRLGCSMIRAQI